MLLLEQRVRSLQRLKPFHVTRRRHVHPGMMSDLKNN